MSEPIQLETEVTTQPGNVLCGDMVHGVLVPASLALVLCIIVDAFVPQVEMFLTGGDIPVPTSVLKFALIGCASLTSLLRMKLDLSWFSFSAWLVFVGYLALDAPFLATQGGNTLFKVLSGYYGYYSLVLMFPIVGAFAGTIRFTTLLRVLTGIFWICAILGVLQRITDSPIVYPISNNGVFEVIAWRFFATNEIRIFSFFVYSVNFGMFCTFIGCSALHRCLKNIAPISSLIVYGAAAICVYLTLTRVVYLVFLVATLCVLILRYSRRLWALRAVPLFGFLVGAFVAYGGALGWLGSSSGGSIGDNVSLIQRLQQFAYYWAMFSSGDTMQKLLGIGYVQDGNVNGEAAIYPIDNLFMALLLHIGIVGTLVFLYLFWLLWKKLSQRAMDEQDSLSAGVCAIWASFLAISLFDISVAFFATTLIMLVFTASTGSNQTTHLVEEHAQ